MTRLGVIALLVAAGCYHKAADNACTLTCSGPGSCPDGETCSAGMCAPHGVSCGGSDAAVPVDVGGLDVTITTSDGPLCLGTLFPVCVPPGTYSGIGLPAQIDTDSMICTVVEQTAQGVPLCVVIGSDIAIPQASFASGARVLVLFALQSITIPAATGLDAGSRMGAAKGPGAGALCTVATDGDHSAGGAGGSMLFAGGNGGQSSNGFGTGAIAGEIPTGLKGGCRGTAGLDQNGNPASIPGDGGGGVYLVAGQSITIGGYVLAGGAGGQGGQAGSLEGGAGGGAGGMIVLDAPSVDLTGAFLLANGGAGGGGGVPSTPGGPGEDSVGLATARGGTPATAAGRGGDGSTGVGGVDGDNGMSGGGGGGGGGYIKANGTLIGPPNGVSPPLQ